MVFVPLVIDPGVIVTVGDRDEQSRAPVENWTIPTCALAELLNVGPPFLGVVVSAPRVSIVTVPAVPVRISPKFIACVCSPEGYVLAARAELHCAADGGGAATAFIGNNAQSASSPGPGCRN